MATAAPTIADSTAISAPVFPYFDGTSAEDDDAALEDVGLLLALQPDDLCTLRHMCPWQLASHGAAQVRPV